jgi:hypothetical protein
MSKNLRRVLAIYPHVSHVATTQHPAHHSCCAPRNRFPTSPSTRPSWPSIQRGWCSWRRRSRSSATR